MRRKVVLLGIAAAVLIAASCFFVLGSWGLDRSLHALSHDLGLCGRQEGGGPAEGCALPEADLSLSDFSAVERRVIDHVCDLLVSGRDVADITPEAIAQATGVSLEGMTFERLQAGVLLELKRRNFNFDQIGGYCSKYSACSVDRDLSGAAGEELERYRLEKSQDWATFTDWFAPDFTLPSIAGERVSLADFRGRPVVLIFMAGHCNHCLDTHDILPELQEKYAATGLVVLPVYVNSGSVEDVKSWIQQLDLNYPILVSKDKAICEPYGSRMVPTFFLIDREGEIVKKLVGYKSASILDRAFAELVRS